MVTNKKIRNLSPFLVVIVITVIISLTTSCTRLAAAFKTVIEIRILHTIKALIK